MNHYPNNDQSDVWSDWLLHRRHAGDPEYRRVINTEVNQYIDRVLDGAKLVSGMTLVDMGAGEGGIGFRAIDRIGPSLSVIFTDISVPMLEHAKTAAIQRGLWNQCTFFQSAADNLTDIGDASVDLVTTRAVLAYVQDKSAAFRECFRVLKPGGRISIAEPIFRDEALVARALKQVIDARPPGSADRFMPLMHKWKSAQFPDTEEKISASPIANYSERDLIDLVMNAGFADTHLELHIDVVTSNISSWDVFIGISPHPWAPSLSVILEERFTAEERQFFEQVLRPIVESSQSVSMERIAYLTASKPLGP